MTDINNDTAWWASSGKHKAHSMQWVFFWPTGAFFKKAVCIDISLTKRHQILTNGVASLAWVKLRSDQNLLSTLWKWASWQNLFCSGRDLIPPYSPCAEFDRQKARLSDGQPIQEEGGTVLSFRKDWLIISFKDGCCWAALSVFCHSGDVWPDHTITQIMSPQGWIYNWLALMF